MSYSLVHLLKISVKMSEENFTGDNLDGCESKEFQYFRFSLRRLCEAVAEGVSLERFQEIYSDVLGKSRAARMFKALVKSMEDGMIKYIEKGIEGDELNLKYKKLSEIIEAYQGPKDVKAWRPPGDASLHLRSPLVAKKLMIKEQLEKMVYIGDLEICCLQQDISMKRTMARNLSNRISNIMTQIYADKKITTTFSDKLVRLNNCLSEISDDPEIFREKRISLYS